jgi:hypothetical protein
MVQHLKDSMHIIKNVAVSLLLLILGEKESTQVREDLKADNSKIDLWELNTNGTCMYPRYLPKMSNINFLNL